MSEFSAKPVSLALALAFACASACVDEPDASSSETSFGTDVTGSLETTTGPDTDDSDSTSGEPTSGDGDESSGGDGDSGTECESAEIFEGQATWYELDTPLVNCSYPTDTLPPYYGAMNTAQYADAAMCGACVRVTGPKGSVDIQVVDQCPFDTNPICYEGHIDLNPAAFEQIGEIIDGVIPITWQVISCAAPDPVRYTFKEGSSQWWTGVLVTNHRNPIVKFEIDTGGGNFKEVPREGYNYFVDEDGFGTGPFTFRLTDTHGNTITDSEIPLQLGDAIAGQSQFPSCD